jgi:nucleoside-diphosphate-sugar epimerase
LLVRRPSRLPPALRDCRLFIGDATDDGVVLEACREAKFIFPCVNFPILTFERNKLAVGKIVAAAGPRCQIIYPGNVWVYGVQPQIPIRHDTPPRPEGRLSQIKRDCDEMLLAAGREGRFNATVVHLPNFYGPHVTNRLMEQIVGSALRDQPITFPGDLDMACEFLYIEDAAEALISCMNREACFNREYTCTGSGKTTAREFCERVAEVARIQPKLQAITRKQLSIASIFNKEAKAFKEIFWLFEHPTLMDGGLLREHTGFSPKVGYLDGILNMVRWYKDQAAVPV